MFNGPRFDGSVEDVDAFAAGNEHFRFLTGGIQAAAQKWKRNAELGARNYHGDAARYCEGLAQFGLSPAACQSGVGQRYAQGAAAAQPNFAQRIAQTDPNRWASRWIEGLSR